MGERLRPYWLHAYLLTYTALMLFADSRLANVWEQYGLGLLTFAVLILSTRLIDPVLRRQVWLCVVVATCFEIDGSLIWGVYHYRFHNLPLYVPAGHGMVYLFALTAAGTPLLRRRGREAAWVVFVLAGTWALAGVTVLPHLTGRTDVLGAALLPLFGAFVLLTPRSAIFTAIFVATAWLEIFGTSFGTWVWMPFQPFTGIAQGNPPSVIAGGYCVIDGSVVLAALSLDRLWPRPRRQTAAMPVVAPAD